MMYIKYAKAYVNRKFNNCYEWDKLLYSESVLLNVSHKKEKNNILRNIINQPYFSLIVWLLSTR